MVRTDSYSNNNNINNKYNNNKVKYVLCALNSVMIIARNKAKWILTKMLVMGHNDESIGSYYFTTIQNQ